MKYKFKVHSLLNKQQLAPNSADTFEQLKQLHPFEDFSMISNKLSEAHECWQRNPLKPKEVFTALKSRKSSSAPGPSGLRYDHLKLAFEFSFTQWSTVPTILIKF
ncbi:hypothetical protein RCL1_008044 [Eukaryota sp. TZLM3-RCL]